MLADFIRQYAKEMGFAPDDLNDVVDSRADDGNYVLSIGDSVCLLREINGEADTKALFVVTLELSEEAQDFEKAALMLSQRLEDTRMNRIGAVGCCSPQDRKLAFFALLDLEGLEQERFNSAMANIAEICQCIQTGKRMPVSLSDGLREAVEQADTLLVQAGIDPQKLKQNFNRMQFGEHGVLFKLSPFDRRLVLRSLVASNLPLAARLEAASANMRLQGRFFFTLDVKNLYFNTRIEVSQSSATELVKLISAHLSVTGALREEYARKAGAEGECVLQDFSNLIPV